jgi:hypothetical protein
MTEQRDVGRAAALGEGIRRCNFGAKEAVARFRMALRPDGGDVDRAYLSCSEAVAWMQTLDEVLRQEDRTYEDRRDSDSGGQVLRGLRYVRNVALHSAMSLQNTTGRHGYTIARWHLREEIDLSEYVRPQENNEQNYDQHVAGRDVLETLELAREFCSSEGW